MSQFNREVVCIDSDEKVKRRGNSDITKNFSHYEFNKKEEEIVGYKDWKKNNKLREIKIFANQEYDTNLVHTRGRTW